MVYSPVAVALATSSLVRGGGGAVVQKALEGSVSQKTSFASMYQKFYTLPEPARYMFCANAGNIVLFVLERVMYQLLDTTTVQLPALLDRNKASASFFLAYFTHVIPQHWFLAFFVYGLHTISTREKYFRTLFGTYQTLSVAMVGSTIVNAALLNMGLNRTVSFVSTLCLFAVVNFFALRWLVAKSEAKDSGDKKKKEKKPSSKAKDSSNKKDIHEFVKSTGKPVKVD